MNPGLGQGFGGFDEGFQRLALQLTTKLMGYARSLM